MVSEIRCTTAYLGDWFEMYGLDRKSTFDLVQFGETPKSGSLRHKVFRPVTVRTRAGFEVVFEHGREPRGVSTWMKSVTVTDTHTLRLQYNEPAAFSAAYARLIQMCDFLSLAIGHLTRPTLVQVRISGERAESENGCGMRYPKIFGLSQREPTAIDTECRHKLFGLRGIKPRQLRTALDQWFRDYEYLHPPLNLHFFLFDNFRFPIEERFLAQAHVIEALDRRTSARLDLPVDQHQERLSSNEKACPPEHKVWLTERLRYSNEASLRRRLKALFKEHSLAVAGSVPKVSDFVERVVNTRNYFTHYSPDSPPYASSPSELHFLTGKLRLLADIMILCRLKFTADEISKMIAGSPQHRQFRDSRRQG